MKQARREELNRKIRDYEKMSDKEKDKQIRAALDQAQRDSEKGKK